MSGENHNHGRDGDSNHPPVSDVEIAPETIHNATSASHDVDTANHDTNAANHDASAAKSAVAVTAKHDLNSVSHDTSPSDDQNAVNHDRTAATGVNAVTHDTSVSVHDMNGASCDPSAADPEQSSENCNHEITVDVEDGETEIVNGEEKGTVEENTQLVINLMRFLL